MHLYVCVYTVCTHFSENWLLSFHQHTTASDLLAAPAHSPGPGLRGTDRRSLPILHFPKLQTSEMWNRGLSTSILPYHLFHSERLTSVHFSSHPSWLRSQFPHSTAEQSVLVPQKVCSWAWHWARATPTCSCPKTLAARSQLWWWLLAHLALGDVRCTFPAPSRIGLKWDRGSHREGCGAGEWSSERWGHRSVGFLYPPSSKTLSRHVAVLTWTPHKKARHLPGSACQGPLEETTCGLRLLKGTGSWGQTSNPV